MPKFIEVFGHEVMTSKFLQQEIRYYLARVGSRNTSFFDLFRGEIGVS